MSGVAENTCSSVQTLRFWPRAPADLVASPLGRAPTRFVCAARLGAITESWLTKGGEDCQPAACTRNEHYSAII